MGENMKKRFYISIFIILSLTVVILSVTYSKDSGTSEYTSTSRVIDNLRVTYENGEMLNISKINDINDVDISGSNISIVNKNKDSINVLIELSFLGDKEVYYSIDDSNKEVLKKYAKEVVNLAPFGTDGDQKTVNIKIFSVNDVNDKVKVNISSIEDDYLKLHMIKDSNVFKDSSNNYYYFGNPNNYVRYNGVYRIIGLVNNKFRLVRFTEYMTVFNSENNYLEFTDFIKTFNNKEIDESNMDSFDTWLKEYNNYWFKDGSSYLNNTINHDTSIYAMGSEVIEIDDYVLVVNGDGTMAHPYEVKNGS